MAIGASAVLLLLWTVGESIGLFVVDSAVLLTPRYWSGHAVVVPCCLAILYGARWLRASDLPATHNIRIAVYGLLGAGGFLAFNVGLMAVFPTESVWLRTSWARWAISIGLGVGLLLGIAQARSIFNTVEAERQSLRAEHLEQQRDLVDHMNSILRHEVLNSTQVIVGNAGMLLAAEEPIDPSDERIERIHRRGEDLSEVIKEVRSILDTMGHERELETIDLVDVVRAEVEMIEDQHPAVTIETRLPERVSVRGDRLLGRVFGNLLGNAVEHNDPESLRIVVDAEVGPDDAVVTIRDDGSGIPEAKLDALFDRPTQGDHGLGLYLVTEIAESYGGSLELVSTGPAGTTFAVTLPVAERQ